MLPFTDVIPQPPIQELSSPEQLNQSLEVYYNNVVKGDVDMASLIQGINSWVDVRDLSLAHVLALERETAGGERIIVSSGKSLRCLLFVCAGSPFWQDHTYGKTGVGASLRHMCLLSANMDSEFQF
jgi:hypothetical protein